jgi:hypothetical protein
LKGTCRRDDEMDEEYDGVLEDDESEKKDVMQKKKIKDRTEERHNDSLQS